MAPILLALIISNGCEFAKVFYAQVLRKATVVKQHERNLASFSNADPESTGPINRGLKFMEPRQPARICYGTTITLLQTQQISTDRCSRLRHLLTETQPIPLLPCQLIRCTINRDVPTPTEFYYHRKTSLFGKVCESIYHLIVWSRFEASHWAQNLATSLRDRYIFTTSLPHPMSMSWKCISIS